MVQMLPETTGGTWLLLEGIYCWRCWHQWLADAAALIRLVIVSLVVCLPATQWSHIIWYGLLEVTGRGLSRAGTGRMLRWMLGRGFSGTGTGGGVPSRAWDGWRDAVPGLETVYGDAGAVAGPPGRCGLGDLLPGWRLVASHHPVHTTLVTHPLLTQDTYHSPFCTSTCLTLIQFTHSRPVVRPGTLSVPNPAPDLAACPYTSHTLHPPCQDS